MIKIVKAAVSRQRVFSVGDRHRLLPRFFLTALVFLSALTGTGQDLPSPSPKDPTDKPSSNPTLKSPQKSPAKPAASPVSAQQIQVLTKATEKVLTHIQEAENDLYLRLNYFEKPERLDPNSFATKEEVSPWRDLLRQLKEKADLVTKLYTELGKDLDLELKQTGENPKLISRFKATILEGFPWDTIEKKKQLIADFIDLHGRLLTFYEKNWGSWKPGTNGGKPEFKSAAAGVIYKKLRDQIVKASGDIEEQYKAMSN